MSYICLPQSTNLFDKFKIITNFVMKVFKKGFDYFELNK